jgi:hypothetical protein
MGKYSRRVPVPDDGRSLCILEEEPVLCLFSNEVEMLQIAFFPD